VTPLGERLAAEIRERGPIGVDRFMAAALGDPEHGYYRTRDPLGAAGDFTTAPEISQVFGEIVGAWLADAWTAMGAPDPVLLVELGPGRGTLMADILRTLRLLPACREAVRVHLVETGPVLRERQRATLAAAHPDIVPTWHDALESVPPGPLLLVANEFFDALPIRQFVFAADTWRERMVGLDEAGRFAFVPGEPAPESLLPLREEVGGGVSTADGPLLPTSSHEGRRGVPEGAIFEICEAAARIAAAIGARLASAPGAALLVDYGHGRPGLGETLQAVRAHRPVGVLEDPGAVDLTAHVDFSALARALAPAAVWGPVTQGEFLTRNGAVLREAALCRGKDESAATTIRRGIRRLLDPAGMGRLFKVLAATSPGSPRPAGF
jgi:NADH dehydrogenase [ubiquinone] 1 alpha subcomplex assembly factor 7